MATTKGIVTAPRVILDGLEFKIGQSQQLRFVKPGTNSPYGYDATIGMNSVDAVYQNGRELWKNMHCQEPHPVVVDGLQVVFSDGTTLEFQETHPKFTVNEVPASYGDYIGAVLDKVGNVHYDRTGRYPSEPKPEIISMFDQFRK